MKRIRMITFITALALLAFQGTAQAETVAAQVGSWKMTVTELDKMISGQLYDLAEKRHKLRLNALVELVHNHLLEKEAKARGLSTEALWEKEVTSKITPVSDEELSLFMKANGEKLPNGGVGMEEQVREFLTNQRGGASELEFFKTLRKKYNAEITLEGPLPPHFTVKGAMEPAKGPAEAPITIIEFSDFECPYCRRAQPTLEKVDQAYPGKIRFIFRHYPLPFHKKAPKASEASMCAHDQGKFWPYHDILFDSPSRLTDAEYKAIATELKLDQTQFETCLDSGKYAQRLADDMKEGERLGVTGTPSFFINGFRLVGAVPFSEFKKVIDKELAKK
ncbi:MAG: thioredoxin domain-containing protein [Magnetococcales bacterium]|nr:thioredoxin domain-containing protein [Magnetococcales bacterium]